MRVPQFLVEIAHRALEAENEELRATVPNERSAIECDLLIEACKQIIAGRGFSRNTPLTGIGSFGFYTMSRFFGFRVLKLDTVQRNHELIDEIRLQHSNQEANYTMYNLVQSIEPI